MEQKRNLLKLGYAHAGGYSHGYLYHRYFCFVFVLHNNYNKLPNELWENKLAMNKIKMLFVLVHVPMWSLVVSSHLVAPGDWIGG